MAASQLDALAGSIRAQLPDRRCARCGWGGAAGGPRRSPRRLVGSPFPSPARHLFRLRRFAGAASAPPAVGPSASTARGRPAWNRRVTAVSSGPASQPAAGAAARRSSGPARAASRPFGSGAQGRGGPPALPAVRRVRARRFLRARASCGGDRGRCSPGSRRRPTACSAWSGSRPPPASSAPGGCTDSSACALGALMPAIAFGAGASAVRPRIARTIRPASSVGMPRQAVQATRPDVAGRRSAADVWSWVM